MHSRIAVIDDDKLYAEQIEVFLGRNGMEVDYFPSALYFIEDVRKNIEKYSVLIIDVDMPMILGDQLFSHLVDAGLLKETCVLFISALISDDVLASKIDSVKGQYIAVDFIDKSDRMDWIVHKVKAFDLLSNAVRENEILRLRLKSDLKDMVRKIEVLTEKEKEALLFICDGCVNKEISNAMNIREATVKKHLSNIFEKMNVRSRLELLSKITAINAAKNAEHT